MRNEAKLNLFKQTSRLGNFKNIASSVANRHQRHLCYELSSSQLCVSRSVCGPCNLSHSLESEPQHLQNLLMQIIPNMHHDTRIARPTWVKQHGVTIKKGAFIISVNCNFYAIFAKVIDVLLIVIVDILEVSRYTDYFDNHFHAYVVFPSSQKSLICFDQLQDHSLLHAHKKESLLFIYLKHYVKSW